jgi:hypothetical protein
LFVVLFTQKGMTALVKVLKVDELPKGFIYFTKTHIVEGTGNKINEEVSTDERVRPKERE